MVRRRNAEDINDLRILEQTDRTVGWVVYETHQLKVPLNVRSLGGTDPGPAGFNWVEIDLKKTH